MPEPNGGWRPQVRVTSSPRRRRTVSARLVDGVLEVRVPAWMGAAESAKWAERMRARIERQVSRAGPTDAQLESRAGALNRRYFGGRLRWTSITYAEQERRWGSCSPESGVIRISSRAGRLPGWVLDYLLVHELAHLEVPSHGEPFWRLVSSYQLTERARGYLMALDHQAGRQEEAGQED
jgi:predicted metal-dependent hydrolase